MSKNIEWEEEALERMKKVPFFVRTLAKMKVEKAARENGDSKVTVKLLEKVKQKEMGEK